MTATIHPQGTGSLPALTGTLTGPLRIVRTADARHRLAVETHGALPGWALGLVALFAAALCVFGVLEWRDVASPLLIACALIGPLAAFTPDLLAARRTTDQKDA